MTAPSDPLRPRPVCDFDLEDLRQSTRFRKEPGTDFAVILRPGGEEVLAEVYDESLTAFAWCWPTPASFPLARWLS